MTFMTTTEEVTVLKTDVLGRVRMPQEKREQLLDEFQRSGMPAYRFAQVHGIKEMTFASWVQKRKRARGEYSKPTEKKKKPENTLTLVEAVVEDHAGGVDGICIEVTTGERIYLQDSSRIALAVEVIKALR